eukprot:1159442-Pelagomonas_calceolata.AAC.2
MAFWNWDSSQLGSSDAGSAPLHWSAPLHCAAFVSPLVHASPSASIFGAGSAPLHCAAYACHLPFLLAQCGSHTPNSLLPPPPPLKHCPPHLTPEQEKHGHIEQQVHDDVRKRQQRRQAAVGAARRGEALQALAATCQVVRQLVQGHACQRSGHRQQQHHKQSLRAGVHDRGAGHGCVTGCARERSGHRQQQHHKQSLQAGVHDRGADMGV